jgi:hypothetical protein
MPIGWEHTVRTSLIAACTAGAAALGLAWAAQAGDPPSSSQTTTDAPHAAGGPKKDDPDRIICKSQQVTGSAIPSKRVCHTKREWDDISEQSREAMDRSRSLNPTSK